jgi:polyisoprenoid-binding protein YceI
MHLSFIWAIGLAALGAAATARAEAVAYSIDPAHTFATFEIGHLGISTIRGRFDKKEGSVTLDRATRSGKVELTIDVTSVSTGVEPFNKNLQGKDFFNTAEFPTARFVGDQFMFDGDKVTEVSGSLTLLGKTNPFTLKATRFNCYISPMLKREVCGGDFEGTLQRSQYGMNHLIPMGAPDTVKLVVQVEAIRQ